MVDAASGGAFVDKTPEAARTLMSTMAANSQQFGARREPLIRKVNEVGSSTMEREMADLKSLVKQLIANQGKVANVCGICSFTRHATNACPTLQEEEPIQQANAMGGFPGQ